MIRSLTIVLCFLFTTHAFAQTKPVASPESAQNPPAKESSKDEEPTRDDMIADGLILGLSYENLDSRATLKSKSFGTTYDIKSDKDLGFLGVRIGYGVMPVRGWGWNGILTFEPSVKKDDDGESHMIYKGEGNVTISTSLTEEIALYGFGGLHLADITSIDGVTPLGFGLQIGAGLSFSANWAAELGYTITIHTIKDEVYDANPDLDKDGSSYSNGGWLLHLNYNF